MYRLNLNTSSTQVLFMKEIMFPKGTQKLGPQTPEIINNNELSPYYSSKWRSAGSVNDLSLTESYLI